MKSLSFRQALLPALVVFLVLSSRLVAEDSAVVEKRLADTAKFLASDDMEGRGLETRGLDKAAEYIAAQFRQLGLKTDACAGTPFQKLSATTTVSMGPNNKVAVLGPAAKEASGGGRINLKLGEDYTPMAMSSSGRLDFPLALVGYGITAKAEKYDDYAGIDVKGKAVVVLRHEPQQADPKSVFSGTNPSAYAPFTRKVGNALEHGAAAVVFVSDEFDVQKTVAETRKRWHEALDRLSQEHAAFKKVEKPSFDQIESQRKRIDELTRQVTAWGDRLRAQYDPIVSFEAGGRDRQSPSLPVVYCRRSVVDRMVRSAMNTDLATIEREIDRTLAPRSRPLDGWRVQGEVQVDRKEREIRNVVAVCEGRGPLANETIVVGAHYDHIGFRTTEAKGGKREKAVFNGADDNASGVCVLLEVARSVQQRSGKPRRRVVFIAFAGEEQGMVGSAHYVRSPLFPIESTVAMLNFDMVGRLRDERLIVGGVGTSPRFNELIDAAVPRHGLQAVKNRAGFGPSDQLPFFARQVPVMHFFTGIHEDYHRPTDDPEKLNVPGMRRIAALASEIVVSLSEDEKRPAFAADNPAVDLLKSVGRALFSKPAPKAAPPAKP